MECLSELDAAIEFLLLEMTNDVPVASLETASRILDRIAERLGTCETLYGRSGRPTG